MGRRGRRSRNHWIGQGRPRRHRLLWETVSELLNSYSTLPARGRWPLLQAFRDLMARHVHRAEEESAIWTAVDQACTAVDELDAIGEDIMDGLRRNC